ncbi:MAG: hypothetical protein M1352_01405 [Patescibacteria group bacterium]|nr:hypothetical protein [Patescibacteria group bacterium]
MSLKKTALTFLALVALIFLLTGPNTLALTQENVGGFNLYTCDQPRDISGPVVGGVGTGMGFYCLVSIAYKLYFSILILLGIGLFAMLLYGGLRYLTSGGDEKAIQSAQKTMTAALMGFGLGIASVFLITVLSTNVLGLPNPILMIPDYACTNGGLPVIGGLCQYK